MTSPRYEVIVKPYLGKWILLAQFDFIRPGEKDPAAVYYIGDYDGNGALGFVTTDLSTATLFDSYTEACLTALQFS